MEHQTLRTSKEDITGNSVKNAEMTTGSNNNLTKDYLHQYYYTMPGQTLPNPSVLGVRVAPLAKFDEKDFEVPTPCEAKHKVKLYKALHIFFSTVIMVSNSSMELAFRSFRLRHESIRLPISTLCCYIIMIA